MTAFEYFSKAEQCEKLAGEIYSHLAKQFEPDSAPAQIFARLADEEVQHAARVRLLGSRYVHDAGRFRQAASNLPNVQAALDYMEKAHRDVVAGSWGDLDAVIARSCELEDCLAVFHAEAVARLVQPELQGFFSTLAQQDAQHRDLLRTVCLPCRK